MNPPPPLGVENVKIQENSEKVRGTLWGTTQKGVATKKIFELRAETRSLRCQMTIANKNFGCSAKPAARRGPKPVRNGIFGAIKK